MANKLAQRVICVKRIDVCEYAILQRMGIVYCQQLRLI